MFMVWFMVYFINGQPKKLAWVIAGLLFGILLNIIAIYLNYFVLPNASAISFLSIASWPAAVSHGPFALFAIVFAGSTLAAAQSETTEKKWRLALTVLGILALGAEVFLNSSRTGYVTEFVILLCLLVQSKKISQACMVGITIAIIFGGAYYFSPVFKGRVNTAYNSVQQYAQGKTNQTSAGLRLKFYTTSWGIIKQSGPVALLFGNGGGSYPLMTKAYYAQLKNKNPNFDYSAFNNPHNQYLLFLVNNGLVGLMLLLAFLYYFWKYIKKLPPLWFVTGWISLVAMMVNMTFNAALMDFATSMFFITLTGLYASYKPDCSFKSLKNRQANNLKDTETF